MSDKALGLLGLMRRANAIVLGEDNTGETVKAGKAKLLLLAQDASENARRRAEGFAYGRRVLTVELPYDKTEFASALGSSGGSMAAITDLGFANALLKALAAENPEKYSAISAELEQRNEKAQRRREQKHSPNRNKTNGNRRTNV